MARAMTGSVIDKSFRPPPGAPPKYWCYLMVETEGHGRVTIRLHRKQVDDVAPGDRIHFDKPRGKNKKIKVKVVGRA